MFFGGLGGHGNSAAAQPGPDAEISLEITLDDAAFGATKEVNVTLAHRCSTCDGWAARPEPHRRRAWSAPARASCNECAIRFSADVTRCLHALQRHGITNRLAVPTVAATVVATSRRPDDPGAGGVEDGSRCASVTRPPDCAGDRTVDSSCTFACRPIVASTSRRRPAPRGAHRLHPGGLGATIEVPTLRETLTLTWRREAPTGPSTDFATRASSTCTGAPRRSLRPPRVEVPTELDDTTESLLRNSPNIARPVLEEAADSSVDEKRRSESPRVAAPRGGRRAVSRR